MSWLAVVYISSWSASAASLMNIHNVYRNNYLPMQFTPIVHSDNMLHLFLRLFSSQMVSDRRQFEPVWGWMSAMPPSFPSRRRNCPDCAIVIRSNRTSSSWTASSTDTGPTKDGFAVRSFSVIAAYMTFTSSSAE